MAAPPPKRATGSRFPVSRLEPSFAVAGNYGRDVNRAGVPRSTGLMFRRRRYRNVEFGRMELIDDAVVRIGIDDRCGRPGRALAAVAARSRAAFGKRRRGLSRSARGDR